MYRSWVLSCNTRKWLIGLHFHKNLHFRHWECARPPNILIASSNGHIFFIINYLIWTKRPTLHSFGRSNWRILILIYWRTYWNFLPYLSLQGLAVASSRAASVLTYQLKIGANQEGFCLMWCILSFALSHWLCSRLHFLGRQNCMFLPY